MFCVKAIFVSVWRLSVSRSRSPILRRRRSEHDRGGGRGGGGRERRRGSQDPPMRHNSDRPGDRNTQNQRYNDALAERSRRFGLIFNHCVCSFFKNVSWLGT